MPEALVASDRSAAGFLDVPLLPMVCSWHTTGLDAGWVQVTGELDIATSLQLRQTLKEAQRSLRLVVLDLRGLTFMDSSGVHLIMDAAADAKRAGGQLLVVRGAAQINRLLALARVDRHVLIFDLDAPAPKPRPRLAPTCPEL